MKDFFNTICYNFALLQSNNDDIFFLINDVKNLFMIDY